MIVVKKVVLILLFLLLGIIIYPSYKLIIIKKENNELRAVIRSIQKDNEIIKKDNTTYEQQINDLKESKQDIWEKLESWKKIKQQIEEATNSQ